MTIEEFQLAKSFEHEREIEMYVVFVKDHKTVQEHGAGRYVMPKKLYNQFKTYINKIRPTIQYSLEVKKEDKVLTTWSGKPLSSDDVVKGIQNFWKCAGIKTNITSSAFRRLVTTAIHSEGDGYKIDMTARHLLHRRSTAEQAYKNLTQGEESVVASDLIHNVMHPGEIPSTSGIQNKNSPVCQSTVSSTATTDKQNSKFKRRNFFSKEEREVIGVTFLPFIEKGIVPTVGEIKEIILVNPILNASH